MMLSTSNTEKLFYFKLLLVTAALIFLLARGEEHFTNFFMIIVLTTAGYFLGRVTCSLYLKTAGIALTVGVFVLMNLSHSLIDGISLSGLPLNFQVSLLGGHEAIRQPTLYLVLWALLEPLNLKKIAKIAICVFAVTVTWFLGMLLGSFCYRYFPHYLLHPNWLGYSIFLFIGDIIHHFADEHHKLRLRKALSR